MKFMCEEDWQRYKDKYRTEVGDVFFTNIGTIGKTAIVAIDRDYLIHWNIFKLRPNGKMITSEFLRYTLAQLTLSGYFAKQQKGGTVDFVTKKMISGAQVLRVDECDLVTPSEIARRIGRSRQLVQQYICGKRGPGGFPPPECHLTDHAPLWAWCAVSYWLVQNNLLRPEVGWNAEVVEAINDCVNLAAGVTHPFQNPNHRRSG